MSDNRDYCLPPELVEQARQVIEANRAAGLRVALDTRNEKIDYKVREHSLAKVPAMLVVGRREAQGRTVALRRLGGEAQQVLALDQAVATLKSEARMPHQTGGTP